MPIDPKVAFRAIPYLRLGYHHFPNSMRYIQVIEQRVTKMAEILFRTNLIREGVYSRPSFQVEESYSVAHPTMVSTEMEVLSSLI